MRRRAREAGRRGGQTGERLPRRPCPSLSSPTIRGPERRRRPLEAPPAPVLGARLITGASDDDPSGIATYGQAGASSATACAGPCSIQPALMAPCRWSRRDRATTGHGIAGVLRQHIQRPAPGRGPAPARRQHPESGRRSGGHGGRPEPAAAGPRWLYVVLFLGGLRALCNWCCNTPATSPSLKWLTPEPVRLSRRGRLRPCVLGGTRLAMAVPRLDGSGASLTTLVAIFGTTISPYLFFWQAGREAEDLHAFPRRREPAARPRPGSAGPAPDRGRHPRGHGLLQPRRPGDHGDDRRGAAPARRHRHPDLGPGGRGLRPLAGPFSATIFALGIIAPGSWRCRSWRLGGLRRRRGASLAGGNRPRLLEARAFYGTVALATLVGMIISSAPSIRSAPCTGAPSSTGSSRCRSWR